MVLSNHLRRGLATGLHWVSDWAFPSPIHPSESIKVFGVGSKMEQRELLKALKGFKGKKAVLKFLTQWEEHRKLLVDEPGVKSAIVRYTPGIEVWVSFKGTPSKESIAWEMGLISYRKYQFTDGLLYFR